MNAKWIIMLILVLPAIPACIFAATLMGVGGMPTVLPSDSSFGGMNPIAAIGWGFGVYFIGLSSIGMLAILIETIRSKNPRKHK